MTRYFLVKPEVAGGLGPRTVMDRSVHPPLVTQLHYEMIDWLGDCIIASFPCFLVRADVADVLIAMEFSGFTLADAEVTETEEYKDMNPGGVLPAFRWLRVTGAAARSDFGLSEQGRLVISERVLPVLEEHGLLVAKIDEYLP